MRDRQDAPSEACDEHGQQPIATSASNGMGDSSVQDALVEAPGLRPGQRHVAAAGFDGRELGEDGSAQRGYLTFSEGDALEILSAAVRGHLRNRYTHYCYGRALGELPREGWLPVALLAGVSFTGIVEGGSSCG